MAEQRAADRLRLLLGRLRQAPLNFSVRADIAELLIDAGFNDLGLDLLEWVARYYAMAGFPASSVAAIKRSSSLGAPRALVERGYRLVARHYSVNASDTWAKGLIEPDVIGPGLGVMPPRDTPLEVLVQEARRLALDDHKGISFPKHLPQFSILSAFTEDELLLVLRACTLRIVEEGRSILREGDPSQRLSILAQGSGEVRTGSEARRIGRVEPGDLIGEMSFITGSPRMASIVATKRVQVLDFPIDIFSQTEKLLGTVRRAVLGVARDRLHTNVITLSSVFSRLPRESSLGFLSAFEAKWVPAGARLITTGAPVPAVYVLLDGRVEAHVNSSQGNPRLLAEVSAGAMLGESLFFRAEPATADCVTSRRCIVLELAAGAVPAVAKTFPQVVEAIALLRERRLLTNAWMS